MKSLPSFLKKYFWDVDFFGLSKNAHSQFIIERILEYGDKQAVTWMRKNFKSEQIKAVVCRSKNISLRSANFWQVIFGLKKSKILCLKKLFQEKRKAIWRY